MDVLITTSVWSRALRSQSGEPERHEIMQLVNDFRVAMIGPIRQEALSGMRHEVQFEKARVKLRAFPDIPLTTEIHELAAQYFNLCRTQGVQGSHIDFLICAVAVRHRLQIYILYQDFEEYAKHLPIQLYSPTVES